MKLSVGLVVSAVAIVAATAAGAQSLPPYERGGSPYDRVSDFGGPYAAMPPDAQSPRYAPAVLPPREVYAIVRENGFSPLGAPQQRGVVYTIAVIDADGEDGRLTIDARNGRIVRFVPGYRMGERTGDEAPMSYSYGQPAALPPISDMDGRRVQRPPAAMPRMANRSPAAVAPVRVLPPRAVGEARPPAPSAAAPAPAPAPAPVQQSAVVPPKPAEASPPAAAPAPVAARPSGQILPTQQMPKVQGLD